MRLQRVMHNRWPQAHILSSALALAAAASCDPAEPPTMDPCSLGPSVDRVIAPPDVLLGTTFVIAGAGFSETCGEPRVYFSGTFEGRVVDFDVTGSAESPTRVRYTTDSNLMAGLGGSSGIFSGEVGVAMRHAGRRTPRSGVMTGFRLVTEIPPRLASVTPEAVTLNEQMLLSGDGFISGAEGTTYAVFDGTFTPDRGAPRSVSRIRIAATPVEEVDRTRATFPFSPTIAGIFPGTFEGTVTVENTHAFGGTPASSPIAARLRLGPSFVAGFRPARPTLGSIVTFEGAGFIGGDPDQTVTLRLNGTLTPHGGTSLPISSLELVPAFVNGGRLAYVVVPVVRDGALVAAEFGFSRGVFSGTATPTIAYGRDRVDGLTTSLDLPLGPIKQVVVVVFLPGFTEALRLFGLRAVEAEVRAQALEKFERTYAGFNIDIREEWPTDYYPGGYAVLEVGGPDPNGRGLFGYDNTPGKDVGNLRLHDRIGGSNAEVQQDGYPGYGGVFIESFFCWSRHVPDGIVCPDLAPEPEFDRIFAPVRRREVVWGEYPDGGDPARTAAIAEAIRVLGAVIGDTIAHEFGHSLGLAHPWGAADLVHNEPPAEGCLMDSGAYRPFAERAEIGAARPGGFCGDERAYLSTILPVE